MLTRDEVRLPRRGRRWLGSGLLLALYLVAPPQASAAPPEPLQMPYLLQSIRSVDRLREVFTYLFGTVLRPDVNDAVLQELMSAWGSATNLEGIDLSQPVGVALVLNESRIAAQSAGSDLAAAIEAVANEKSSQPAELEIVGADFAVEEGGEIQLVHEAVVVESPGELDSVFNEAQVVVFATITDWTAARRLLASGMTATTHLAEAPGRTDLFIGRDSSDGEVAMAVRITGSAAYIGDGDCEDVLDRLAVLRESPSHVAQRHDATFSLRLNEMSPGARRILSETLWKMAGPDLQRHDDESPNDYAGREATTRSLVELIDVMLSSVEDMTAALDVDEPQQQARVRLEVNAVPQSPLADRLAKLGGPPSRFQPLVRDGAALTVSISLELTEFEQELVRRWLNWFRSSVTDYESTDGSQAAWLELLTAFDQTVAAGHLDFFCEFDVAGPTEFGVIGGLRLREVDRFRNASRSLLQIAQEDEPAPDFVAETLEQGDFTFHHLSEPDGFQMEGGEWLPLDICFTAARGALWFSGGAFDSQAKLKDMLDRVEQAEKSGDVVRSIPPLLVRTSAARWLNLPSSAEFDSRIMRSLAERAFASDDGAQLELRASRRGLRLEAILNEGFIRWAALLITHQHDSSNL